MAGCADRLTVVFVHPEVGTVMHTSQVMHLHRLNGLTYSFVIAERISTQRMTRQEPCTEAAPSGGVSDGIVHAAVCIILTICV
jgi:hypothetical protein